MILKQEKNKGGTVQLGLGSSSSMGHAVTSEDAGGITPQTDIDCKYQSMTEKGIRYLCSTLLEMKKTSAAELNFNLFSNYTAFLSVSQDLRDLDDEVTQLKDQIFSQKDLVNQLKNGGYLEALNEAVSTILDEQSGDLKEDTLNMDENSPTSELEDHTNNLCDVMDVLLAEHKKDEALARLHAEEDTFLHHQNTVDTSSAAFLFYQSALLERKEMLAKQLAEVVEFPAVSVSELRKALSGLLELGHGGRALDLLLHCHRLQLRNNIENLLPSSQLYSGTYGASLAQIVFSVIAKATKDVAAIFGDMPDMPEYMSKLSLWAQKELRRFVKLIKNYLSSLQGMMVLQAAAVSVQASVSLSATLDNHGLLLSAYVLNIMQTFWENTLDEIIKNLEEDIYLIAANDDWCLSSSVDNEYLSEENSADFEFQIELVMSAYKFYSMVEEFVECMTPFICFYFGESILNGLACLFDCFINACIKAIPCPCEDEGNLEYRDNTNFIRAETESQQLALLGSASALADELLPISLAKIFKLIESQRDACHVTEEISLEKLPILELKDWKSLLQGAADRLRNHFCQQYVLSLIYNKEGTVQLTGNSYLTERTEDLFWDPDAMPSSSFQALYIKLNEFNHLAASVLVGREKVVKQLFRRLISTVILWLSNDQDFWEVIEDESAPLTAVGLQQFMLDMHFLSQISKSGGYSSKRVNQSVSSIIDRAINVFSMRGIDLNSALPEDDWFLDSAKAAIYKLSHEVPDGNRSEESLCSLEEDCAYTSGLSNADIQLEPSGEPTQVSISFRGDYHSKPLSKAMLTSSGLDITNMHLEQEWPDESCDSPSSITSTESFASADMEEFESFENPTDEES